MSSVSGSDGTYRGAASSSSDTLSMYQSMTVNANTDSPRESQAAPPFLEPNSRRNHGSRDAEEVLRGITRPMVRIQPSTAGSQDTPRKRARSDDGDEVEEGSPHGSDELGEELEELHKEGEPARQQREAKKQKRMASLPTASPSPAPKATEARANPPETNSPSTSAAVTNSPPDGDHPDKSFEEKPEEKPSKETTPSPSSVKVEVTTTRPASPRKT